MRQCIQYFPTHPHSQSQLCKKNSGQCHRHVIQYMAAGSTHHQALDITAFQVYLLWRCQHVISMFRAQRPRGQSGINLFCYQFNCCVCFGDNSRVRAAEQQPVKREREGNWIFLRTRAAFPSSTQRQQQQRAPLLAAKHTCTTSFIKHPSM